MATFDRRRIPAPETSYAPIYEPTTLDGVNEANEAGPSTPRRSDRRNDEARPVFLKTGLISQANGSGYIESGGVKIACSVYGPRPKAPPYSPQGSLNLEVKFAPFASDPRRAPLRDTEPAHLSLLLTQLLLPTLHLHLLPKSSVDVYLLILESDTVASVLSAGLTVASAAVADAGIDMAGLGVGGVVVASPPSSSPSASGAAAAAAPGAGGGAGLLVDPTKQEELSAEACLTIGSIPALSKLTNLHLTGEVELDQAVEMINAAFTASRDTHTLLAQALLEGAEERGIGAATAPAAATGVVA